MKNRPTNLIKFSFHHKMVVDVAVTATPVLGGGGGRRRPPSSVAVPTLKKCNILRDGLVNTYLARLDVSPPRRRNAPSRRNRAALARWQRRGAVPHFVRLVPKAHAFAKWDAALDAVASLFGASACVLKMQWLVPRVVLRPIADCRGVLVKDKLCLVLSFVAQTEWNRV